MDAADIDTLRAVIDAERERMLTQIASLESTVASIVEATELVSTDDEHDPEGATIAYERAQALALLKQAHLDLDALADNRRQLDAEGRVTCSVCGGDIAFERAAALPMATRCVGCAD